MTAVVDIQFTENVTVMLLPGCLFVYFHHGMNGRKPGGDFTTTDLPVGIVAAVM